MTTPKISLLIPTWHQEALLDITLRSVLSTATVPVEALVFSQEHRGATEEVVDACRKDGLPVRIIGVSRANEGVAFAVNACAQAASGKYFFYVGDDMYALEGWLTALLAKVKPGVWQYLTPRSIEPTGANPAMYAPHDFGRSADTFCPEKLAAWWATAEKQDVVSRWGPPFVLAEQWKAAGGFDPGYFPGFGTDPDFAIRMGKAAFEAGQEIEYRAVGDCGMYHFQCATTGRVRSAGATLAANIRFQERWGCTPTDFGRRINDGMPL